MAEFRQRAQSLTRTAQRLAELRGATKEASVLAQSKASLIESGYDNWNDGTTFYTLTLEVPLTVYAQLEDDREKLEKSIKRRVSDLTRGDSGVSVTEVVISPDISEEDPVEPGALERHAEAPPRFWASGHFRLFLSHPSAAKKSAHEIKAALADYRIAAFVAHDDIEPTREWQPEIEAALRTMDALAAILTADFLASRWCDQEVGIAIGKDKLVVPLRAGADPHGFLGKYQGLLIEKASAPDVARRICETLIKHPQSSPRMCDTLVDRMANAPNYDTAKRTISLLELSPRLNRDQVARLVRAAEENSQVKDAFTVPNRITALVARVGAPDQSQV